MRDPTCSEDDGACYEKQKLGELEEFVVDGSEGEGNGDEQEGKGVGDEARHKVSITGEGGCYTIGQVRLAR